MANQGDYGCNYRAKLTTSLDHDDVKVADGKLDAVSDALNLARLRSIHISIHPEWDGTNEVYSRNATSDNLLFDAVITAKFAMGKHTNSEKDEDFAAAGNGYYAYDTEITFAHFVVDASAWGASENLVDRFIEQAIQYLDTEDVKDAEDAETPANTYTYDTTPAP